MNFVEILISLKEILINVCILMKMAEIAEFIKCDL
jgi:hypothetical protein